MKNHFIKLTILCRDTKVEGIATCEEIALVKRKFIRGVRVAKDGKTEIIVTAKSEMGNFRVTDTIDEVLEKLNAPQISSPSKII